MAGGDKAAEDGGQPPRVLPEMQFRIGAPIRQRVVDLLYKEYIRLLGTSTDARLRAAALTSKTELAIVTEMRDRNAYNASAARKLMELRRKQPGDALTDDEAPPESATSPKRVAAADTEGDPPPKRRRLSVDDGVGSAEPPPASMAPFKHDVTVDMLERILVTPEELAANNYPLRVDADIEASSWDATERVCARCGRYFTPRPLNNDDLEATACMYHPKRVGRVESTSGLSRTRAYVCCMAAPGMRGCTVGPHVYQHEKIEDVIRHSPVPFRKSRPVEPGRPAAAVVALDCEMVYTVHGLELARVSAVDLHGALLMDAYVKPVGAILDYNTVHSGITAELLARDNVLPFEVVSAQLDELIDARTILIGHALENDVKVLRLVHTRAVDTALLFRGGMWSDKPYKIALHTLAEKHLGRKLDRTTGHDSLDDARATLELALLRAKEAAEHARLLQEATGS